MGCCCGKESGGPDAEVYRQAARWVTGGGEGPIALPAPPAGSAWEGGRAGLISLPGQSGCQPMARGWGGLRRSRLPDTEQDRAARAAAAEAVSAQLYVSALSLVARACL